MCNFKEALNIAGQAFFISFVALFATDFGLLIFYSYNEDLPLTDWGVVGRWFVMLSHGQFYTPAILNEPSVPHEYVIGFSMHTITAFIFTLIYVYFMRDCRPCTHLYKGPLFGLVLAIFPLCIQQPSMGMGFLGRHNDHYVLLMTKIVIAHVSLGFGLAIGMLLMASLFQERKSNNSLPAY